MCHKTNREIALKVGNKLTQHTGNIYTAIQLQEIPASAMLANHRVIIRFRSLITRAESFISKHTSECESGFKRTMRQGEDTLCAELRKGWRSCLVSLCRSEPLLVSVNRSLITDWHRSQKCELRPDI